MKLAEFRNFLDAAMAGDIKIPDGDKLLPFIKMGADRITKSLHPLELIELDDESFEVSFWIDEKYFIRKIEVPTYDENAQICFNDEHLCYALVYQVALLLGRDGSLKLSNERAMFSNLMSYEFNMFDESHESIEDTLKKNGFFKPYTIDRTMVRESRYIYDEAFLEMLGDYLLDKTQELNPSYRKYIADFFKFQDGDLADRADLVALDAIMVKRISNG
jgi:hypothetical protein